MNWVVWHAGWNVAPLRHALVIGRAVAPHHVQHDDATLGHRRDPLFEPVDEDFVVTFAGGAKARVLR